MEREIYSSSNGDHWYLVRRAEGVAVKHQPNAASGGRPSYTTVGAFLRREGNSPEYQALLALIGTLAEDEAEPPIDDSPARPVVNPADSGKRNG